jgi:hypothetical protein
MNSTNRNRKEIEKLKAIHERYKSQKNSNAKWKVMK